MGRVFASDYCLVGLSGNVTAPNALANFFVSLIFIIYFTISNIDTSLTSFQYVNKIAENMETLSGDFGSMFNGSKIELQFSMLKFISLGGRKWYVEQKFICLNKLLVN